MTTQIALLYSEASTAGSPQPTLSVHVIVDQVYALSLASKPHGKSLSTGVQAGIGVGASVAGLAVLGLLLWSLLLRRRLREEKMARRTESLPPESVDPSTLQPSLEPGYQGMQQPHWGGQYPTQTAVQSYYGQHQDGRAYVMPGELAGQQMEPLEAGVADQPHLT